MSRRNLHRRRRNSEYSPAAEKLFRVIEEHVAGWSDEAIEEAMRRATRITRQLKKSRGAEIAALRRMLQ